MRFGDLLATAISSLWQRKFRTFLTVLGVLIGTTAVVVMVSLGLGMAKTQFDAIERYSNVRQVIVHSPPMDPQGQQKQQRMDDEMLMNLQFLAAGAEVYPVYEVQATAKVKGYETWMTVRGIPKAVLDKQNFTFAFGGPLTTGSDKLQLVIGHMVPMSFWNSGGSYEAPNGSMVGETLKLDFSQFDMEMVPGNDPSPSTGQPMKKVNALVAGQLDGPAGEYNMTADLVVADLDALVKALKKVYVGKALPGQDATAEGKPKGTFKYSQFIIETETIDQAKELFKLLKDAQYGVEAPVEWMEQMQQQTQLTLAVFGGIGAISLLVAAIGIANTMMMSVYERTREIGVMKVLGAALGDIRSIFLLEAAGIGFIGGVLGVLFSYPLGAAVSNWVGSSLGSAAPILGGGESQNLALMPPWLVGSAILFATLIGTLAGLLPAHRAMRLSALDAIRTQ